MNPVRIAAMFAIAALLVACAGPTPSPSPIVLDGTSWRAVTVAGRIPPPGSEQTVSFDGARIGGSDGCNSYGADFQPRGTGFAVGTFVRTLAACDDAEVAAAEPFLAILSDVERVDMVDGRLILAGPAGEMVLILALDGP